MPIGDDDLMPAGYWRGRENNHVFTTLYNKSGVPYTAEIINYPILDAAFDNGTGELLYRTSVGNVQAWRSINVSSSMQPIGVAGALSKGNGLYINPKNHQTAGTS